VLLVLQEHEGIPRTMDAQLASLVPSQTEQDKLNAMLVPEAFTLQNWGKLHVHRAIQTSQHCVKKQFRQRRVFALPKPTGRVPMETRKLRHQVKFRFIWQSTILVRLDVHPQRYNAQDVQVAWTVPEDRKPHCRGVGMRSLQCQLDTTWIQTSHTKLSNAMMLVLCVWETFTLGPNNAVVLVVTAGNVMLAQLDSEHNPDRLARTATRVVQPYFCHCVSS